MTDIIIRNPDDLPAERCIELVRRVIMSGPVNHRGRTEYPRCTTFPEPSGMILISERPMEAARAPARVTRVRYLRSAYLHMFRVEAGDAD